MIAPRRIPFKGDDASYIAFLETRVLELERALHRSSQQRTTLRAGDVSISENPPRAYQGRDGPHTAARPSTDLEVVEWQPRHATTSSVRRASLQKTAFTEKTTSRGLSTSQAKTRSRRKANLDGFLKKIPPLEKLQARKAESMAACNKILRVLAETDALVYEAKAVSQTSPDLSNILPILQRYCDITLSMTGDIFQKVAVFRELIFMSMCAVALKSTSDTSSVFNVMRSFSGSKAQEKHLNKLVQGAIWANRCIFALSKTCWSSHCSSIFFDAGQTVTFYARYAEDSKSLPSFIEGMKKRTSDTFKWDQVSGETPLTIPLIVERLLRGSVTLSHICEYLGYELDYVQSCFPIFERALSPSSGNKRHNTSPQPSSSKRNCLGQSNPFSVSSCGDDNMVLDQSWNQPIGGEPGDSTDSESCHHVEDQTGVQTTSQPSEAIPQADDDGSGTSDVWFSTYRDLQLGELAAQRYNDDPGTNNVWFSTYSNSQRCEPMPQADDDNDGTSDVWFSTYRDLQLGELAAQADGFGTSDVWFSTYSNSQLGEPAAQGAALATSDSWFGTNPTSQLSEPVAQLDTCSNRTNCVVPELNIPPQSPLNLPLLR